MNNGDFIRRQFKDGKLHGEGNVNWNDGTKFVGNFVQDKKYGKGTYVLNDGQIYKETLEDDNLNEINMNSSPNLESIEGLSIE